MVMWIKPLTIRYHIHTIYLTNKLTFFSHFVFFLFVSHSTIALSSSKMISKEKNKKNVFWRKNCFKFVSKRSCFFQCDDHNIFADWKRKKLRKIISLIILVVVASNNNYFQHRQTHTKFGNFKTLTSNNNNKWSRKPYDNNNNDDDDNY